MGRMFNHQSEPRFPMLQSPVDFNGERKNVKCAHVTGTGNREKDTTDLEQSFQLQDLFPRCLSKPSRFFYTELAKPHDSPVR